MSPKTKPTIGNGSSLVSLPSEGDYSRNRCGDRRHLLIVFISHSSATSGRDPRSSILTVQANSGAEKPNFIESFNKWLVDSSKSAVKGMQVMSRRFVSQNYIRYQEEGFGLVMTYYITENMIAVGFRGGDFEFLYNSWETLVLGFYHNHMEEVIKFFETHHEGKYKAYNLCSERL
ncbi:hypothetical protein L6164_019880 [Bauhinia variegata]|uniref:Uncharacterized protein n=1 Tax=Bauhinia variegata TaxID=167791 RepID=A0ACB9MVA2_BAUVA|nr:hypothetical protein L6164_019880 [Bauhinia variegata]